jgi:hypothetical protein
LRLSGVMSNVIMDKITVKISDKTEKRRCIKKQTLSLPDVSLPGCDAVYYTLGAILRRSQYLQYREPNASMADEL